MTDLIQQTYQYQKMTWRLLLALIVWLAIAKVVVAPSALSVPTIIIGSTLGWLLHSLALLFFAKGIRQGNPRTAVWMSYVLMVYFIYAVVRMGFNSVNGWVAIIECLLITALFASSIRYVKLKRATQNGEL